MSSRGWKWKKKKETKAGRTGVESRVLLDVAELLEAAVAVGAAVGLLAGVDADVLHQLVVRRERLETLLALVRLRVAAVRVPHVHLHRRFRHKNLPFAKNNNDDDKIAPPPAPQRAPTPQTNKKKTISFAFFFLPATLLISSNNNNNNNINNSNNNNNDDDDENQSIDWVRWKRTSGTKIFLKKNGTEMQKKKKNEKKRLRFFARSGISAACCRLSIDWQSIDS